MCVRLFVRRFFFEFFDFAVGGCGERGEQDNNTFFLYKYVVCCVQFVATVAFECCRLSCIQRDRGVWHSLLRRCELLPLVLATRQLDVPFVSLQSVARSQALAARVRHCQRRRTNARNKQQQQVFFAGHFSAYGDGALGVTGKTTRGALSA